MTSAAIYARVSSARQKKDQTIGSQTAALRAHAAEQHLELPEEWVFEDEGHSGATLVRPALERLRDLVAQVGVDVVLCYAPDRLARKFAYQALLIEEFARAGTRVEFVRGPRGDTPEDQLMVQFQGMFAEYEKAQLMERYRRGKTYRARSGSVNVLGGAPFGYRYLRKTPECGATYEIVECEAALVVELFRRYTDDGASIADLTRWLTSSNTPTRTGKTRWDPSVVWGMLRNPVYQGQAAFGKTRTVHESPGLNRRARLEGRTTPRAVKYENRPREEWITIPVPALITPATFERAAQRLADNKRFASRNSKVPSLLQGLSACVSCGYGYYRTSTTTSSGKKIYYYRCLGSDDYRYEGGRVCTNKPVRADYLDTVVWDHVVAMIADPHLIRSEIDKRLERARTSDPATRQRGRLELALAKATTSITRMIEAFQEQLVTIDELRARMPDLRARESNLRSQLGTLDAQIADRDAYLKLADDLEGFLTQLRESAGTAEVPERQRVLRLLVKDVLVGPEKITIRHRIPVRERTADDQHQDQDATEGDSCPSYPLRWGRGVRALGQCPCAVGAGHGGERTTPRRQQSFGIRLFISVPGNSGRGQSRCSSPLPPARAVWRAQGPTGPWEHPGAFGTVKAALGTEPRGRQTKGVCHGGVAVHRRHHFDRFRRHPHLRRGLAMAQRRPAARRADHDGRRGHRARCRHERGPPGQRDGEIALSMLDVGADHPRRTSANAPHEPRTRVHASPRHGIRRLLRRWWRPAAKAETKAHARMASALLTAPAATAGGRHDFRSAR
ncbi:recombinase family protein [Streptomyces lunaelactis]|uniref:recombinase family protein n=1 Tax=Streptomyces lunaelactis TaxID=1535768 RepID=UPI001C2FB6A4|nr:recombinase family protein [Streptomyces lunaelactis]